MGEVRSLRWSWLGDLDRKYNRLRPQPQTYLPGCRPLPPSMSTARELFIVGRVFQLLLGNPGRLTCSWIVVRHRAKTCQFKQLEYPQERVRSLPWSSFEDHILQNRVRFLNSVDAVKTGRSRLANRRATPRSGPAPSSS